MKKDSTKQREEVEQRNFQGRDEMNLAEFPIAALGKRQAGQRSLIFVDTIYHEAEKKPVTRTLTITASEPFGLPTSRDEEVILALIQLSAQNNFTEKEIFFTRYEIIKLLGWKDDGVSYKRVENSLRLWLGVHLFYDKAWWDKSIQSWVKEGFNILDSISIYDKERRRKELKISLGDPHAGLSRITWGSVIFKSFQAGNIKRLNFDFYTSLSTPIAKRMFRFLDKRFYHSKCLEFELKNFAYNHIGLSEYADTTNLKAKLKQAIKELEEKGFLIPLSASERFYSPRRGVHYVRFERSSINTLQKAPQLQRETPPLGELSNTIVRIKPRTSPQPTKEELETICEKFNLKWRPS